MQSPALRYSIVSPVKDEAAHLARTADALVAQTHRPAAWVIVDDGSTDGSDAIAEDYAQRYDWIHLVRRANNAPRARGGNVVLAFNDGLSSGLAPDDSEFIVKLDGDLYVPPNYFEWVADTFATDPKAGIVGGLVYVPADGRWIPDDVDPNSVHGAVKAYRRTCFDAIGGLHAAMGWDGIDEFAARARGWSVRPLSELQVLHYAPRGSKQDWREARREEGRGAHFMGYRFPYLTLRALYRLVREYPVGRGGFALWLGYASARRQALPMVGDPLAIDQLRREHRAKLKGMLRLRSPRSPGSEVAKGPAYFATPRVSADGEPVSDRHS